MSIIRWEEHIFPFPDFLVDIVLDLLPPLCRVIPFNHLPCCLYIFSAQCIQFNRTFHATVPGGIFCCPGVLCRLPHVPQEHTHLTGYPLRGFRCKGVHFSQGVADNFLKNLLRCQAGISVGTGIQLNDGLDFLRRIAFQQPLAGILHIDLAFSDLLMGRLVPVAFKDLRHVGSNMVLRIFSQKRENAAETEPFLPRSWRRVRDLNPGDTIHALRDFESRLFDHLSNSP